MRCLSETCYKILETEDLTNSLIPQRNTPWFNLENRTRGKNCNLRCQWIWKNNPHSYFIWLLHPTSGSLYINDDTFRKINLKQYHSQIAISWETPFEGTLLENIFQ
jgi:hypothetical protein